MAQLPRIDDMRPINELHRLEHAIAKGWLAVEARVRDLGEVHPGWRGAARLKLRISETAPAGCGRSHHSAPPKTTCPLGWAFSEPENPEPAFTKLVYPEGSL